MTIFKVTSRPASANANGNTPLNTQNNVLSEGTFNQRPHVASRRLARRDRRNQRAA
ncbi:MAG: hypothetical protein JKX99_03390 [Robiginitomaculum sp.]|nr:hypothetical protein [Robiginitomaculum sp.]